MSTQYVRAATRNFSCLCKIKKLKITEEKQVLFATDSNFELFDVVRQARIQNQKLSAANERLTEEKWSSLQEKDKQLREKDKQLREKDRQLYEKDKQIQEKDQEIKKLQMVSK